MASLNTYLQQVQRLTREHRQQKLPVNDLVPFVNIARREIAMNSQCIRVLPRTSGQIITLTVASAGAGYSTGTTMNISSPDYPSGLSFAPNGSQATGTLTVDVTGTISAASIIYGGEGYFQPVVTLSDPNQTGSGGTITASVSPLLLLNQGQEVYNFSDVDLSPFSGVESIYGVRSVSIIYNNYRYSLPMYSFSTYQAMIRQYPFQYQYVPTFCTQFGQGTGGSIYVYPLPSQTYQMEWDCQCLPSDLTTDGSPEAIEDPWTDAVPYMACYHAYLELQNFNAANFYLQMYDKWVERYSRYPRIGRVVNPYGRF